VNYGQLFGVGMGIQMTEENKKPDVVADGVVVSLDYTLTVDGEVIDTTQDEEPLEYLQGHKNIIPGLEKEMYGMAVGDAKDVQVPANQAYGDINPEAVVEVPRSDFPEDIPVELGVQLQVRDQQGDIMDAIIQKIEGDTVTLDFNHPLAGQDLNFSVKVVDLREATEEELEHGHVHGGHDEWDEDFEDDDYEGDEDDLLFEDEEEDD
jgi:FKBP-type peptidyl-prolyl cis-trans isomerase SlyD